MKPRFASVLAPLLLAALGCQGEPTAPSEPTPRMPERRTSATVPLTFRQVSAGSFFSCGVTTDNQAYCWGYNANGQLGQGANDGPEQCVGAVGPFACSTRPVLVTGGHQFLQVSAGSFHACAVTTENEAFCWGDNIDGTLGDGTDEPRYAPVAVMGGHQFREVRAGLFHTCGLTMDDQAYCWGANDFGQLGDGSTIQHLEPVAVVGGLTFRQLSTSIGIWDFTCGVTSGDNQAFCWGSNRFGQLGVGSNVIRRVRPSPVVGGWKFVQVEAGYHHVCGVTIANRALCWGDGTEAVLGNGRTYLSFWPRQVDGGLSFAQVTAGITQSCGITTDQQAYCWGLNTYGDVGDGSTSPALTPVAVAGGLAFAQLSAGELHTCGTTVVGEAYCWGYDFFAQLGDGNSSFGAESHVPVAVIEP
jgi:alpha-tubulin suppressor-like RCC1 family protein